ncbi:nose resistant to fluoxetine protein 6-like isoform X2 [Zophobas morio]
MGNFDECVNLKQPTTSGDEEPPIQGQYCLADVELFNKKQYDGRVARSFETFKDRPRHVFNNTMYWSICVPSSCTVDEVKFVIKEIFTLATKQKNVNVRLSEDKCHIKKPQPFSTMEIVYGTVVGAFTIFVFLATAFHYYVLQQEKTSGGSVLKEAILCFSVIRTVGKFLTTKSSELNLECICGIRFISMIFIISGHTFLFMVGGPVQNVDFYDKESRNPINAIFVNSPLLVDTFLLISGFLLCYLLLIELEKRKGRINVPLLYIARYIRLTPSYLVVLGFYCTFFFRIGDGPLWDSRIKLEQERCQKSWWTNLLYVNNYVYTDSLCMFQSWYLAADYHLFIIAPLIIYPLWKFTKIGKAALGAGIFVTVVAPFIITLTKNLDPTLMIFAPEMYDITQNSYFKTAYIKTHMRAGSYFFGLLFGYILYKLQTKGTKMSKYVIWFGWMLSATCGIIAMYSVVIFYDPHHQYNAFEAAVYASLHRVAWCISIGWIMIVCVTKNASLVNRFLSWKPFIPLSRLTYCAYLVNGFIEVYSFASLRQGTYMSIFEMGSVSLSHTILTFSLAFLMCIFFESPIHGLEKIFLKKGVKKQKEVTDGDRVNNTSV